MKNLKNIRSMPIEVKSSVAYTICSVIQQSLSVLTIPIFTRLLTTTQYGQYSVYTSWLSILAIFTTLNLPYGSFNTALIKFENDRDRYISSVQGICIGLALIALVIYLPFSHLWNRLFTLPTLFMVIMIIEAMATASLQFWYGKQRFDYRYKGVIVVTLIIAFCAPGLALFLVTHVAERGYARIFAYSIVNIIVGCIFAVYNLYRGHFRIDKKYVKYALSFNFPLIPYYLSQTIFNQSDRLMINSMVGTDKSGIYSVAYSVGIILTVVLTSINNSYVPWFYRRLKDKNASENRRISMVIAGLMAFLLMGVIILAPEIILVMGGRKYLEAMNVVPPVAMSILLLFYAQLFINVEFYYEKKTLLVFSTLGSAVLNIVLNAVCIHIWGYVAAGYTTLASYVVFAWTNYLAYKRTAREMKIEEKIFDLKGMVILAILMFVCAMIAMALYPYLIARLVIIACVFAVVFIFRKKLMEVYHEFREK